LPTQSLSTRSIRIDGESKETTPIIKDLPPDERETEKPPEKKEKKVKKIKKKRRVKKKKSEPLEGWKGEKLDVKPPIWKDRPKYDQMSIIDQGRYRAQFNVLFGRLRER
jgi:hypothetical protein